MIYLYQFEDGTIKQDDQQPTSADLAAFEDGILNIFRVTVEDGKPKVEQMCGYTDNGAFWGEVQRAEVAATQGIEWHQ